METAQVLETVAAHPLLRLLDARVLDAIVRGARVVPYRQKRPLIKEGDPSDHCFVLLSGAVRVFHRNNDGAELLVKLFRAPAFFGEMEVLAGRNFLEYVTTIEPSTVLLIPAESFKKLVRSQPKFAQAIAVDLAARLCIATHGERALAFCDVDTRLCNLLLDYAQFFGEPSADGVRLKVALSQDSMARDLAVSRKSLTRSLVRMREEGLIDKKDARYVLRDLDALRRRSSGTLGLNYTIAWGAEGE